MPDSGRVDLAGQALLDGARSVHADRLHPAPKVGEQLEPALELEDILSNKASHGKGCGKTKLLRQHLHDVLGEMNQRRGVVVGRDV